MSETETHESAAPSAGETALGAVKGVVEEHPVAILAGGILLGALIAGAISRPAKDTANKTGEGKPKTNSGRSFARRAVQIAALGAELAAAYAAGADSVVEDHSELAPPPGTTAAPEPVKSPARRISSLATAALRALGPLLGRKAQV